MKTTASGSWTRRVTRWVAVLGAWWSVNGAFALEAGFWRALPSGDRLRLAAQQLQLLACRAPGEEFCQVLAALPVEAGSEEPLLAFVRDIQALLAEPRVDWDQVAIRALSAALDPATMPPALELLASERWIRNEASPRTGRGVGHPIAAHLDLATSQPTIAALSGRLDQLLQAEWFAGAPEIALGAVEHLVTISSCWNATGRMLDQFEAWKQTHDALPDSLLAARHSWADAATRQLVIGSELARTWWHAEWSLGAVIESASDQNSWFASLGGANTAEENPYVMYTRDGSFRLDRFEQLTEADDQGTLWARIENASAIVVLKRPATRSFGIPELPIAKTLYVGFDLPALPAKLAIDRRILSYVESCPQTAIGFLNYRREGWKLTWIEPIASSYVAAVEPRLVRGAAIAALPADREDRRVALQSWGLELALDPITRDTGFRLLTRELPGAPLFHQLRVEERDSLASLLPKLDDATRITRDVLSHYAAPLPTALRLAAARVIDEQLRSERGDVFEARELIQHYAERAAPGLFEQALVCDADWEALRSLWSNAPPQARARR